MGLKNYIKEHTNSLSNNDLVEEMIFEDKNNNYNNQNTLEEDQNEILLDENPSSDKNLYFSIGAHPAFCCNFTEDEYRIGFSKNGSALGSIAYHGINEENGLSITEDLSLKLTDGAVSVSKDFFDRCALIFEGRQADEVSLISKDGNAFVSVSFDMPLFALWSPEGKSAPFICIEPWCGRCDHEDFRGTLEEREYSNSLSAGGYFESGYTVRFN